MPSSADRRFQPVTLTDVARHAGVSQSTVSRALRDDPRVSLATRERIRLIATTINYSPNLMAQSLITGVSRSIAVLVADLQNPVYPQLVDAVQTTLNERGYRMPRGPSCGRVSAAGSSRRAATVADADNCARCAGNICPQR